MRKSIRILTGCDCIMSSPYKVFDEIDKIQLVDMSKIKTGYISDGIWWNKENMTKKCYLK